MELVTGAPAPTLERDQAVRLLREMAAVVRTVLGVEAGASPAPAPAVGPPPAPAPVPAALAVPALAVPGLAVPDPAESAAAAMLQELAFLDD